MVCMERMAERGILHTIDGAHESANPELGIPMNGIATVLTDLLGGPNANRKDRYASCIRHLPYLERLMDPYPVLVEPN